MTELTSRLLGDRMLQTPERKQEAIYFIPKGLLRKCIFVALTFDKGFVPSMVKRKQVAYEDIIVALLGRAAAVAWFPVQVPSFSSSCEATREEVETWPWEGC